MPQAKDPIIESLANAHLAVAYSRTGDGWSGGTKKDSAGSDVLIFRPTETPASPRQCPPWRSNVK